MTDDDDDDTQIVIKPGAMERLDVMIVDAEGVIVAGGNIVISSEWLAWRVSQPIETMVLRLDLAEESAPASLWIGPPGVELLTRKAPRH